LVCALLSLVLAVILIGGFIAVISFILGWIGFRRSAHLGSGRRLSLAAMALSVLAVIVSVAVVALLFARVNSGEDIVRDGIATRSTNEEFPPQDDLDEVDCSTSEGGDSALAIVTITNRSGGQSNYQITVAWDNDDGDEVLGIVNSDFLAADDSQTMRLFSPRTNVDPETCRVTRIERSFIGFFS